MNAEMKNDLLTRKIITPKNFTDKSEIAKLSFSMFFNKKLKELRKH